MAERIPISKLAKLTQRTESSLRAYLQVGSFDESHADETASPISPREAFPALFACDPASGRSHIEFSRSVEMGALSYRLTADAHPHPGQGFARDDIGVTSSGFVVLDLVEITRRVFEAADEAKAA